MIVSIHQPAYLPWLGYFHRIAASDHHIVLDHVQFEKNSFINRNKVRTTQGWCWLTVPVKTKGRCGHLCIRDIEIDERTHWRSKHWRTIEQSYARASWYETYADELAAIYARNWGSLGELCRHLTGHFLEWLGIGTPISFSSDWAPESTKDELVLELCKKVGATVYYSGALGRNYLDEGRFAREGIRVDYQNYQHPAYPQCQPGLFQSHMGAVDLLMNCGPESLGVLLRDQEAVAA